jgi:hypothetical protein
MSYNPAWGTASSVNFGTAQLTGALPIANIPVGTSASTVAAGNAPDAAITAHLLSADPHGDRSFATSAVATHTAAADVHGDRAFATAAIATHAAAADPHGDRAVAVLRASNLSDLANAGTARTNLGLGTAAVTNTGVGATNTILGNDARLTDSRVASAVNLGTATLTGALPAANMPALSGDVTNSVGSLATTLSATLAARLGTNIEQTGRVFKSALSNHATPFLLVSGVAYFVYLGRLTAALTPKFVELHVSTIGVGAQTAELGLFSSPSAPSKAGQSLTKLTSTATLGALTSLGVVRNTSAFSTSVPAGTHLWAGIRTALATTQPTLLSLGYDLGQGNVLSLAAAGALTGTGPFAGGLITASVSQIAPDLRVTLD